jgi:uncharacterized membrane protein YfcA
VGLFVVVVVSGLANAGGLGGGGILTPYIMIFFKLSIFECLPLANLFGLIATTTRFTMNYHQKHPNPAKAAEGKVSIDYELVMFVMPMMYLGTLIGVQIGSHMGEFVLASFLLFVTGYALYKTVQNAINVRMKELKEDKAEAERQLNKTS